MTRETWRNWILVFVVAALGAGAVAEEARDRLRGGKPMLDPSASRVREIERDCSGCVPLRIVRRQGSWEITRPWVAPASDEAIERLFEIARTPARTLATGNREPAEIGLEPPWATLRFDERTLEFGSTTGGKPERYVRLDQTLALVPDRFQAILTGPPEGFVDPRPLAGQSPVSGMVLGQPMDPVVLERFKALVAHRVEPVPATFPGHTVEFTLANGRVLVFYFDLRDDGEMALVRHGVRVLYLLTRKDREALGFAT